MRTLFIAIMTVLWGISLALWSIWPEAIWVIVLVALITIVGCYDMLQTRHALWRNFPVLGRGRWVMEFFRPFLRQYFFESETDGTPINRMYRNVVYQRAKGARDTIPYGTKLDTQAIGYEWIGHSLAAIHIKDQASSPTIQVGGPACTKPYQASIFNISAMSFGALSANSIRALNKGAYLGKFYHNTGEGSISAYHLEHGGDLVWQIGTGYFGCRDSKGQFCAEKFRQSAELENVKMIEIKLSQGAKPGHGGILPADKNSLEIARIRLVEPATKVESPPTHSAFDSPLAMVEFIHQLRQLSGGKPIGFKLAVGRKSEFVAICKAMVETGIMADFVTVDGGEGGTGAAPLEYSNSVGMPLREALSFVVDVLTGFGLKKHIKVIASGKVFTGFDLVKNMALGADMCNSARGMMMALGCVQSLVCNTNQCPTGIATQNPHLAKGLDPEDKAQRVRRYHDETVHATMDILTSAGISDTRQLNRSHIYRRVSETQVLRYDEIYPALTEGCLLTDTYPERFTHEIVESCSSSFMPKNYFVEGFSGLKTVEGQSRT